MTHQNNSNDRRLRNEALEILLYLEEATLDCTDKATLRDTYGIRSDTLDALYYNWEIGWNQQRYYLLEKGREIARRNRASGFLEQNISKDNISEPYCSECDTTFDSSVIAVQPLQFRKVFAKGSGRFTVTDEVLCCNEDTIHLDLTKNRMPARPLEISGVEYWGESEDKNKTITAVETWDKIWELETQLVVIKRMLMGLYEQVGIER